jgi:hypothetical protein
VKGIPFIDGAFVPDGSKGPVQVDSAGHTFEFDATCNLSPNYVWSGSDPYHVFSSELDGIDYAAPDHSILQMHANNGVTFDLDAIRRANPGQKVLRFVATVGNTETNSVKNPAISTTADFWVLVDGDVRNRRHGVNGCTGAFSVIVAIGDKDRFLTLASTDGGDGISCDWIIFGDPKLEMTPIAASSVISSSHSSTKQ